MATDLGVRVAATDGSREVVATTRARDGVVVEPRRVAGSPCWNRCTATTRSGFRWRIWSDAGSFTTPPFTGSITFLQEAAFFTQYAQSTTMWSPDSSAFAYPAEDDAGPRRSCVQPARAGRSAVRGRLGFVGGLVTGLTPASARPRRRRPAAIAANANHWIAYDRCGPSSTGGSAAGTGSVLRRVLRGEQHVPAGRHVRARPPPAPRGSPRGPRWRPPAPGRRTGRRPRTGAGPRSPRPVPSGGAASGGTVRSASSAVGTHPRSTSTRRPSSSTSGVRTWSPGRPSSGRPYSTSCPAGS